MIRYSACGRDPDASFPSTLQYGRIFEDTLWFSQVIYMLRGGCLDRAASHIVSVTHSLAHRPSSGVGPASQTLYHSNWNRRTTREVRHPRDTLTARRLRECLMVFARCSQGYSCLPYEDIMHLLTVNRNLAISAFFLGLLLAGVLVVTSSHECSAFLTRLPSWLMDPPSLFRSVYSQS